MTPLTKKYQVWELNDASNYTLKEFDTLEECIASPKYSAWYITKRVSMAITDNDEAIPVSGLATKPLIPIPPGSAAPVTPVVVEEERTPIANLYDTGRIGKLD